MDFASDNNMRRPPAADSNSFTPDGTVTVTDTATDEDGKQFYTIMTPAGNTFYLIIDLERDSDNVYFLDAVTEDDLLGLAELSGETVTSTTDTESKSTDDADLESTAKLETEQPGSNSNTGMLLLVAAVVLIGGGAARYFNIHRSKQQMAEPEDDYGGDPEGNQTYCSGSCSEAARRKRQRDYMRKRRAGLKRQEKVLNPLQFQDFWCR